ncbi:MarR family winged helix-turn-helix transcriptional regulator [Aneurinibacillus uraniidurans]|uniref:MarR family winged helix-turn-helix transcriptional regulator n=1 Tax=Aneurinibacillus uraniidurans TaxID=2966586 RepID=UPI00234B03B4|nr:MarR family transcriptional regulator [Aneurinibacillus sp. B1]WCN36204.1 MarR family transcriptional regulator [Aneurinibacillus sp. B1]
MPTDQVITNFMQALRRTLRASQQILNRDANIYNLTIPQVRVLHALYTSGSKSLAELSKQIDTSISSTSGVIDRLERMELVIRTRDKEDRRKVWITLSDSCRTLMERFPISQAEVLRPYFAKEEEVTFIDLTHQLLVLAERMEQDILNKKNKGGTE